MEYEDMSFNELANYIEELEASIEEHKTMIADLRSNNLKGAMAAMQEDLRDMKVWVTIWEDIAEGLYEGLLEAEDHLTQAGYALRPYAQDAVLRYRDLISPSYTTATEEADETGEDENILEETEDDDEG